jgi:hypothetical protein
VVLHVIEGPNGTAGVSLLAVITTPPSQAVL